MQKKNRTTSKAAPSTMGGFTLIEMIVAIGVFAIMSVAIAGAFTSGFSTYGETRALQRDVESAQYAINTLEKLLRTSTIKSATNTSASGIVFYDYSSSRCFQYRLNAVTFALEARWYNEIDVANCLVAGFGAIPYSDVTSGYVTGRFIIDPSDRDAVAVDGDGKEMGRVTVVLSVKADAAATLESRMQTSVSLRDYSYVGF